MGWWVAALDELRMRFRYTADFKEVPDWEAGAVLINPGQLAFSAPNQGP